MSLFPFLNYHTFHRASCRFFVNPICLPNTNPDPERTEEMTREERQLRRELKTMRKQISALCAGCRDDENRERWTMRYAEELSYRRTGTLLSWDSWKAFYAYLEGTKDWADAEHSHRRTIAILDEEIDLCCSVMYS